MAYLRWNARVLYSKITLIEKGLRILSTNEIFLSPLFSYLHPLKLLQRPSQLIRTRRRSGTALDSVQSSDGLIYVHALDEPGQALGVAGAAAYKLDIGQFIIFYFKGYFPGTDPLCFKSHV